MIKNRRYKIILSIICILVVIISILISANSNNIEGKNKSWMRDISDEKKLSDIMIPGVHNAATSRLPLSLFARCQSYSIYDLLNAGYRYLDIRAGIDDKTGEKRLFLYHNFIRCYSKDTIIPQRLTLDDVLMSCYDFLEENPSETIIFMVKYEHGELSVSEFEKLVDATIEKNSDKWLLTDKTPCLKDARGKIVLYRRYEDEALLGSKSGIECIWNEQKFAKVSDLYEDTFGIQDMYKLNPDEKWEAFSYVLNSDFERNDSRENYPIINFLSTAGSYSVGVPIHNAKILNKNFMNYTTDEEIYPQWIIVDFGDEKIAEKIIKANF